MTKQENKKIKEVFTKDLDGVLLVVINNTDTYELRRSNISSYTSITSDNENEVITEERRSLLLGLWRDSDCINR